MHFYNQFLTPATTTKTCAFIYIKFSNQQKQKRVHSLYVILKIQNLHTPQIHLPKQIPPTHTATKIKINTNKNITHVQPKTRETHTHTNTHKHTHIYIYIHIAIYVKTKPPITQMPTLTNSQYISYTQK